MWSYRWVRAYGMEGLVKYISIVRYTLRLKYGLMFVCTRLRGSRACVVGRVCVRVFVCVGVGVGGVVLLHVSMTIYLPVRWWVCVCRCVCVQARMFVVYAGTNPPESPHSSIAKFCLAGPLYV